LLPSPQPVSGFWLPAGLHGGRLARRDDGGVGRRRGAGAEGPPSLRRALWLRHVLPERHGRPAAQVALQEPSGPRLDRPQRLTLPVFAPTASGARAGGGCWLASD